MVIPPKPEHKVVPLPVAKKSFPKSVGGRLTKPKYTNYNLTLPTVVEDVVEETLGQDDRYKTEMCKNIIVTGFCTFGDECSYAHT